MKLWKIMLAALVAVLLISTVAMAEATHTHVWSESYPSQTGTMYTKGDEKHYALFVDVQHCVCGEVKTSPVYEDEIGVCDFKIGDLVKPTCTEYGYRMATCKLCGYTKKIVALDYPPTNHPLLDGKKLSAGDCQTASVWGLYCPDCDKVIGDTWKGDKGAHVYSVSKLDATCTEPGWIYKTCTVKGCKDTDPGHFVDEPVPARGFHRWDYANSVIVAPTCKDQGYSKVKCMDCGFETKHDYVDKTGHNIKWTNAKAATCGSDGWEKYGVCRVCNKMFDAAEKEISKIPTLPANQNAHEVANNGWTYHITSCTDTRNNRTGICTICGKTVTETIGATEHKFADAKKLAGKAAGVYAGVGVVTKASTCEKTGAGYVVCTVCTQQAKLDVTIPATGHDWYDWAYGAPATCIDDMVASRTCKNNAAHVEWKTVVPALGHTWVDVKGTDATCTTPGKLDRKCAVCNIQEYGKTIPAKGHAFTKVEKVVAPTCDAQGYTVYSCANGCGETQKGAYTAAAGHNYSWVVVTKPSAAGNGRNEYKCSVCGNVAKTETVKYSNWYYNNTFTSFGPSTRELVGGNDWYRVTPVDLTVDGVYTYDLIASNKYVVGKVTIAVNAGALTVSYKTNNNVEINAESLLIYANKADLAAGVAVSAPVGAAIDAAANFPGDSKVLVSLVLTGNYDAAGKSTMDASAAAGMVANID